MADEALELMGVRVLSLPTPQVRAVREPSVKATVPVGAPRMAEPVTVAVKVTVAP